VPLSPSDQHIYNGIGFLAAAGGGAEPYGTVIWNSNISDCSRAYDFENTLCCVDISNGLINGNYTDLYIGNGGPIHYHHVRGERGTAQIVATASSLTLEHLSF
jgi:hypothetical protein